MIHVASERVTPIAAIEAGDITPKTSKKAAAKRLVKDYGLIVAGTVAAALVVIHLNTDDDTETTEED